MRKNSSTQNRKLKQALRRRRLASALLAAMAMPAVPAVAQNLPSSGTVISGDATIGGGVPEMVITQTTKGAIINWGSFNVGSGYGVTFDQQFGSSSVTLNRVVGFGYGYGGPSYIDGNISANGNVFIINPWGITFGNDSQVNVGGLVASTLGMTDADFNAGLSSGQYHFTFDGSFSPAYIENNGTITAGDGGLGFVGPMLENRGSMTTNGGNIAFGAATDVTLDFDGDGLTQVTINLPSAVDAYLLQNMYGTMQADAGKILLRSATTAGGTGGQIYASGQLVARTLSNVAGRVELTTNGLAMLGAPGNASDVDSDYTTGVINLSSIGPGMGGSVLIQGSQVTFANNEDTTNGIPASNGSSIIADGLYSGGQIDIISSGDVALMPLSVLSANGVSGAGGTIRIQAAGNLDVNGTITASSKDQDGGSVSLEAGSGQLQVFGDVFASGPRNGGQITVTGQDLLFAQASSLNANGGSGVGGSIQASALNYFAAFGAFSARGNTAGGSILTRSGGLFDLRGLQVDAGAGSGGTAGTWTLDVPQLTVINGSIVGNESAPLYGTSLQDADINRAFYNGTNVILGSAADIQFNGAQIQSSSLADLFLQVNAVGRIYGSGFTIAGTSGALDMDFNADSAGSRPNAGGIDFTNATLDSMGGDIRMFGQSDAVNGAASSALSGISLTGVDLSSGGGDVLLRGYSTGSGSGGAGVFLDGAVLDAGAGGIAIYGEGAGLASGVLVDGSVLAVGAGGLLIDGYSLNADGLSLAGSDLNVSGGDIDLTGVGADQGVYFAGNLYSGGGDITVHGEGGSGDGTTLLGVIDSAGGDIDLFGLSSTAMGMVLGGGSYSGVSSGGGDITLYGHGDTAGLVLRAGSYGGDVGSAGGMIQATGIATGAGATGVSADDVRLLGGTGNVRVEGNAAQGIGVQFINDAGIVTTTGAIGLYGTGATFGLDIADGAIDTDSGDITLDGEATASGAVAGVRVTGDGLTTDGGNITVHGVSAGGVGVQLGDGSTPFAVGSGGGAILIDGTGVAAGVQLLNNQVASGGGAIGITGQGGVDGIQLDASTVDSGGGTVNMDGTASEADGVGVLLYASQVLGGAGDVSVHGTAAAGTGIGFAGGSSIVTTTGAIGLYGTGATFGLDIADGAIDTDSGDITLDGEATASGAVAGVRVTGDGLTTDGGNITVHGVSAGGVGVQLGDGSTPFAVGSGGGAILIDGTGVAAGVQLLNNQVASGGGAIGITGQGGVAGIQLDASTVDSGGGTVNMDGTASEADGVGVLLYASQVLGGAGDVSVHGTAAAGTGIGFASGSSIVTTTGAIGLYGTGATFGLDIADGAIDTDSGDITLDGEATASGAVAGVRVTGDGLTTDGGNITVHGVSAGGVGVQLGDGSTPFAVGSGGGAILIDGTGVAAGVQLLNNQVASGGGAIGITGQGGVDGIQLDASTVDSGGGTVNMDGTASEADGVGVLLYASQVLGGAGDVSVHGTAAAGTGIGFAGGSSIVTTTGAIGLYGTGATFGLDIADGAIDTDSGDITLDGEATASGAVAGVRVTGDGLTTDGGNITVHGVSAGGVGVQLGDGSTPFAVGSGGGAILINGTGVAAGVQLLNNQVASGGGAIFVSGNANAVAGTGLTLSNTSIEGTTGDVSLYGTATQGVGIAWSGFGVVSTTSGNITMAGVGADVGLELVGGTVQTDSGHLDLRGRGMGTGASGLVVRGDAAITTAGGGISLSGEGGSGAGIDLEAGTRVDAGDSLVVVRAGNDGSSDALRLGGTIHSGIGVNLRPGGVDANGEAYDRTDDEILLGGAHGFALDSAELARIAAPEVVIGSQQHAGAIRVLTDTTRDGNLTLQNQGGSGGVDLQAALGVGDHTLTLASGGSIIQTAAGALTAHSLLAMAGGDVLLAVAQNDVASTTLAGVSGGAFEFQDGNDLAVGSVSGIGFDAGNNQLASLGATGVAAGGDVLVRNLQGDLTLLSDIRGEDIDLVTAGRLQNLGNASLHASGDWRVWAATWEGETRGGLAGSGGLPNLYGCLFLGACGVTVSGGDNHFVYVQQPVATVVFGSATREYGLDNPAFTFTVTGAILGDSLANVATGTATTTATIGSDVGLYPINGTLFSAAGYRFEVVTGTLSITPATLLFTANPFVRYLGSPNPLFTGEVTGFRNGDTVESVFGNSVIWSSPAGPFSPVGFYPVFGGVPTKNYVFSQAPGNEMALHVIPLPQLTSTPIGFISETVDTYVYDSNFGAAPVCALNSSLGDEALTSSGDQLASEWTKVRTRPNLINCFDSERKTACGDF